MGPIQARQGIRTAPRTNSAVTPVPAWSCAPSTAKSDVSVSPQLAASRASSSTVQGVSPIIRRRASAKLNAVERELLALRAQRRYWEFYALAIRERKNIVISGATGSGKTTFGRALVNFIPDDERLLTIEDVREMFLPNHPNRVHVLYSEGGQGTAEIPGKTLLQACLRMKRDRVLLAELCSKVAHDYIVNISSGHPGSITTVHAGSAAGAFEMLMLRVKEPDEGQSLERSDIQGLLRAEAQSRSWHRYGRRLGTGTSPGRRL